VLESTYEKGDCNFMLNFGVLEVSLIRLGVDYVKILFIGVIQWEYMLISYPVEQTLSILMYIKNVAYLL
jgi:hypothetical protein